MHLHLQAPINQLGYGVVGFNVWHELRKRIGVTLWPIGGTTISSPVRLNEQLQADLQDDINKQAYFHRSDPCLKIWHEFQLADYVGNGTLAAYSFFEVSKFIDVRKSHVKATDIFFVASHWAKEIVERETGHPNVVVAPCGVDRSIFDDRLSISNPQKCIFLNCGKWEKRKGHDILADAFIKAFGTNQDVQLWMLPHNPFLSMAESAAWADLYKHPNITILDRVPFHSDVASIMSQAFCGVFPSRAEGWNLEALEMMSLGKHVIVTDYSAHKEFCNSDNSLLLPVRGEEVMYDGRWFKGEEDGVWAQIDVDDLVEALRSMYKLWQDNAGAVNTNGIETAKQFSWQRTADVIASTITSQESQIAK